MAPEVFHALFRNIVFCIWFAVYEAFFHGYIARLLQRPEVTGEVAVCHLKGLTEADEVHAAVDSQHRHDTQPDTALKSLVEVFKHSFHPLYLRCMNRP